MTPPIPDFRCQALLDHVRHTLSFYHPRAIDPSSRFCQFLSRTTARSSICTRATSSAVPVMCSCGRWPRHLPTPRPLFDNAGMPCISCAMHTATPVTGGYAWNAALGKWTGTHAGYHQPLLGLAFVLLAYAHAVQAGIAEAGPWPGVPCPDGTALLATGLRPLCRRSQRRLGTHVLSRQRTPTCTRPRPASPPLPPPASNVISTGLWRSPPASTTASPRRPTARSIWEPTPDWQVNWDYNRHDMSNISAPGVAPAGHFTNGRACCSSSNATDRCPGCWTRRKRCSTSPSASAWDESSAASAWLRP